MDEKKEFSINLKPEVSGGKYSNLAVITHSRSEFILDFAAMLPGVLQPEVVSRVIMNPEHAKRLLSALQDNVAKYEAQFGKISFAETAPAGFPVGGNGTRS
ncbi:MAG: DUF3467 domain-containing protein [Bacteroidales bacterium]|nr:DUF3467 domain-containing protein [Bacteroidales bacterium]